MDCQPSVSDLPGPVSRCRSAARYTHKSLVYGRPLSEPDSWLNSTASPSWLSALIDLTSTTLASRITRLPGGPKRTPDGPCALIASAVPTAMVAATEAAATDVRMMIRRLR